MCKLASSHKQKKGTSKPFTRVRSLVAKLRMQLMCTELDSLVPSSLPPPRSHAALGYSHAECMLHAVLGLIYCGLPSCQVSVAYFWRYVQNRPNNQTASVIAATMKKQVHHGATPGITRVYHRHHYHVITLAHHHSAHPVRAPDYYGKQNRQQLCWCDQPIRGPITLPLVPLCSP